MVGWNYLYRARELDRQLDEAHREALINAIRSGLVTAWGHFKLHGSSISRPTDGRFHRFVASQKSAPKSALKLGDQNSYDPLPAMGIRKILWDFSVVCLSSPSVRKLRFHWR